MWLEKIIKQNGKFVGAICWPDGRISFEETHLFHRIMPVIEGDTVLRLHTNFSHWRRTSTASFLCALEGNIKVDENHRVFAFDHNSILVIIPALVLAATLFRSFYQFSKFIFRPQGIDLLCAPILGKDGAAKIEFLVKRIEHVSHGSRGMKEQFCWLYTYPSARHTWSSAYYYALQQQFAFDLPLAAVEIQVEGKILGDRLYVRRSTILSLTAMEAPMTFAPCQSRHFIFHPRQHGRGYVKSQWDMSSVLNTDEQCRLSDGEWDAIQSRIDLTGMTKLPHYCRRLIIETILTKIKLGVPWSNFCHRFNGSNIAQQVFYQYQRDGRWEQIVAILENHRLGANIE